MNSESDQSQLAPNAQRAAGYVEPTVDHMQELEQLKVAFEARLINAHLRTEAVRAGMLDLDGLKLADLSSVKLGHDYGLVGGREVMDTLRRTKPWLFGSATSSSSPASPPSSQPARPKSALEMTDEEYIAARAALVSRRL